MQLSLPRQASQPLRVCRIATIPFFLLHHLGTQIRATAEAGHDVLLVSSPGPEWAALRSMPGVRAVELPIARVISPLSDLRALFALWRLLRRERVDIVHSTTPKAGLLSAIAGLLAGVPVRLHTFTGQAWVELEGWRRRVAVAADRLIVALNTRCYADSASQREFMEAQGVAPPGAVMVLGAGSLAGVDPNVFDRERNAEAGRATRARLGIGAQDKVIVFVGRVTRDKGIVELVQAFQRLSGRMAGVHLVLVGPEEPERDPLPEATREAVAREPGIHAVGYESDPEHYLASADLICLPSYREGFGNVVIEAAAMGLPAVGTRIPGLRDAIVEGVTGVLVPAKDPVALERALADLLLDDALRQAMGAAAQERALREFDSRVVNARVLAEYATLAGWRSG
ncbi:MAG: glycosyltransferase family 4 protein [Betaproteobacteria bacterium]|nr:glycosyltransferase family 4 protein [Betaproteobacteria bacterium]